MGQDTNADDHSVSRNEVARAASDDSHEETTVITGNVPMPLPDPPKAAFIRLNHTLLDHVRDKDALRLAIHDINDIRKWSDRGSMTNMAISRALGFIAAGDIAEAIKLLNATIGR